MDFLIKPPFIEGWDDFGVVPTWSFLVESPSGKKAVFDLGLHKDPSRLPPPIFDVVNQEGVTAEVKEHVADIIKQNGVDLNTINSIIWRRVFCFVSIESMLDNGRLTQRIATTTSITPATLPFSPRLRSLS